MILRDDRKLAFTIEASDLSGSLEFLPSYTTSKVHSDFVFLDALIHPIEKPGHAVPNAHNILPFKGSPAASTFLTSVLQTCGPSTKPEPVAVRFLFASTTGYVVRSDFLEHRLECSQCILKASSFLTPLQKVAALDTDVNASDLASLLSAAIGAVALRSSVPFHDLDIDLQTRVSSPWLQLNPIPFRRLAWVQGREDIDCIERAFRAAAALGIKLVILDEPGHWLQDSRSSWAYLREAFVEVDITPDEGLAGRVVEAVRVHPSQIDGIVTISDVRLPAVARACHILGFPTESAEAYDIAADKGRTRLLESVGADESFVLPHADALEPYLGLQEQPLRFPLVVKPVIGWCSDCVSKVQNDEELTVAVHKASDRHANSPKPSTTVVVEPYVDGPEVDANFAILDGEILFFDINDDFPSPADERGAGFKANFQETQNVMPSGLPKDELDVLRDQMRASILRQGFKSGVFHCEARVRNSGVEYVAKEDGVVDMVPKKDVGNFGKPEVYLHENNARPPGYLESVAVSLAYGVDYYALRMLLALGPSENSRLRALSQPFLQGPQFQLSLMIIQQTRAGIMKTQDAAKEFLDKHPDIRHNVVDYYTRKKGGDVLEGPDASALWWIAYFSVVSRTSREELLQRVEYIQQNFEYELEE